MIENGRRWIRRQGKPLTLGVMAALVVASIVNFAFPRAFTTLAFNPGDFERRPWSILTYPLAYSGFGGPLDLLFFVFLLYWILFTSGFLENDAGLGKAAAFWAAATFLPVLLLGIGMRALGFGASLTGPYLPLAAVTVYWGIRNKEFRILLWGILPIKGLYIAILDVAGTFFVYAQGGGSAIILGLLACVHLAIAWVLAEKALIRIPAIPKRTKAQIERDEQFEEEVRKRKREREEMERLRKLLEGPTGGDDR